MCYRDNARALRFYESLGAGELSAVTVLRLDERGMEDLIDGHGDGDTGGERVVN